jgi:preprotein translocase subunit YajC
MGVGNKMSNITDIQAAAIAMIAFVVIYSFLAWREDRMNKKTDEAWRAGYEQGLKVVQKNVR